MFLCWTRTVALLAIPLVTTACIGAEIDDEADEELEEPIGEAEGAVVAGNGALSNIINRNALLSGALTPSLLGANALKPSALSAAALAAIQDPGPQGTLSRQLLQYVVSCALRPDQSFSFTWTDSGGTSRQETYSGYLGIVDWWVYGPLTDPFYQRYISACLAARTNYYGVPVMISLRASQVSMGSSWNERSTYSVREGAFWGNLFTSTPYLRACHSPAGVARARALKRDCAAGHIKPDPGTGAPITEPCGPIALAGSCDTVCEAVVADGGFYSQCLDNPAISSSARTDVVITSFLPP
ncbi:hypothetical protein [Sorangium sp. So ce394]|uniref:hypothetical protein n=1 Tax=Sorangium sp. So ce394 TaxID=3133310 RepID=UPI003F5C9F26